MAHVLRGEVYWGDLNPIRGCEPSQRRPLLVLSREVVNARSGTALTAAITSQPQAAGFPLTLKVESVGLPKDAWIKLGQVRTLSTDRLGDLIGKLSPEEMARVMEGLNEIMSE